MVASRCLLDILEKERYGINLEQNWGEILMRERAKESPNEKYCEYCIERRDEGLRIINEARDEMKAYMGSEVTMDSKKVKVLEKVIAEVEGYRNKYGHDICSDVKVNDTYVTYVFMPGDVTGYVCETDFSGKQRTRGLGSGCFWTEWR